MRIGPRTYLRRPCPSDREGFLALRKESAAFLHRREPRPATGVARDTPEHFAQYVARARTARCAGFLLCRREDRAILGVINLNEILLGPFRSSYLGYWIGEPHARQGYMTEGLGLALLEAFLGLRLHRVEANIDPDNTSSIALVRRLGFRREGYSPRYLKIDGRWTDHERWALLAEDWRARSRA